MGKLHKCARCGLYYSYEGPKRRKYAVHEYDGPLVNLCPECSLDLEDFMRGGEVMAWAIARKKASQNTAK